MKEPKLPPWKKPRKKTGKAKSKLTPELVEMARARAKANSRRYPNLVDNMWAAKFAKGEMSGAD